MKEFIRLSTILLLFAILISSCSDDDNPVEHEEHDHFEAVGLVISSNGTEVVRNENGEVTGKITVENGKETSQLVLQFIDEHDGDLGVPEGDEFSLDYTIADSTIASLLQKSTDGNWNFHIQGKKAGSTTIEIKIMHEDHPDFVSLPITIEVTN